MIVTKRVRWTPNPNPNPTSNPNFQVEQHFLPLGLQYYYLVVVIGRRETEKKKKKSLNVGVGREKGGSEVCVGICGVVFIKL